MRFTAPATFSPRCRPSAATRSKTAFWELFDLPGDVEGSEDAVRLVQANIDRFARRFESEFPSAVKCLLTDRQALTAYLRFPSEH